MSDFQNQPEYRTAHKAHKCIYCAEPIAAGEKYVYQKGIYEGRWYSHKVHPECFEKLCDDDGEGEFIPYSNDRPPRAW